MHICTYDICVAHHDTQGHAAVTHTQRYIASSAAGRFPQTIDTATLYPAPQQTHPGTLGPPTPQHSRPLANNPGCRSRLRALRALYLVCWPVLPAGHPFAVLFAGSQPTQLR
eukprot:scaffold3473_cov122-Isochrysis_galbana.AAC.9